MPRNRQRRKSLIEAVANNRKAVDLAMTLYVGGKSDFLNVLIAQRSLFTSEDALAQSTRTVDTNLIALYKALGGGWEQAPLPGPKESVYLDQLKRFSNTQGNTD